MTARSPRAADADTAAPEDLAALNRRISDEAAAATTAEARGARGAGAGLAAVTTDDVS